MIRMWMTERLLPAEQAAGFDGAIEADGNGALFLNDGRPVPLSGVLAPYGYISLPAVGSTGRALPDGEKGYLLAGVTASADGLQAGEVRISSAGGAYILLKNTGEVVINGLVIGADGKIADA